VKIDLINLAQQCCDADGYLSLGYRCAQTNYCYDELRPVGDALWFSLPYRLGLGEASLIYMQDLLVLVIGVSLLALFNPDRNHDNNVENRSTKKIAPAFISTIFTLVALLSLMLQVWPTFFNSLADTPASLFLIEGLLLILIAAQRQSAGLFFAAGIFLGCSSLMRAAYFNPLCAVGLVFFIFWCWHVVLKKKKELRNSLLILSFTLPMTLQFYTTWQNMQEWSFLSKDQTQTQLGAHLNSAVVGYDTLLIEAPYYWAPPCRPSKGVLAGLRNKDVDGLYCLLSNRVYFYFGSYAPHTFYGHDNKNLVGNGFAEDVGNLSTWNVHNMGSESRYTLSPRGDKRASRLFPQVTESEGNSYVQTSSLTPLQPDTYHYSIWLWANETTTLDLQFLGKTLSSSTLDWNNDLLHQETIDISKEPKQFFFEIHPSTLSYLVTRIGSVKEFFAWGSMLESAASPTGYLRSSQTLYSPIGSITAVSNHERVFSKILLLSNVLAIFISFFYLLRLYKKTSSPAYLFVASLLLLILMEALLILPEQRFLQGALTAHWILCLLFLYAFFYSRTCLDNKA